MLFGILLIGIWLIRDMKKTIEVYVRWCYNLSSSATVVSEYLSESDSRYCWFRDTFIIFMKEQNVDMPYFALKVDNTDVLEKK